MILKTLLISLNASKMSNIQDEDDNKQHLQNIDINSRADIDGIHMPPLESRNPSV